MKVFLFSSFRGKKVYGHVHERILAYLKTHQIESTNRDFVLPSEIFFSQFDSDSIQKTTHKYEQYVELTKKADICLFECSVPTLAIGYLIHIALENNIPVIAFFQKGSSSLFLSGIHDEKFQYIQYEEPEIEDKLEDSLKIAQNSMDKRFNFFVSPTILAYLNKISREQRISKSNFIRNLIKEHMKKNH